MRYLLRAGALLVVFGLVTTAGRADTVRYHDPGSKDEVKVEGTVAEEGPAGIAIKRSIGPAQKIPATAIVDVEYTVSGDLKRDYLQAILVDHGAEAAAVGAQRTSQLREARKGYQAVLPQVSLPPVKRQLRFRIAWLTAQLAESDPAELPAALQQLKSFKAANPESWQITACCRMLGELQSARGEYQAAEKTYEDLEAIRGVPADVKQDCSLRIAELLLQQHKITNARARVNDLLQAMSANDPKLPRLKIMLAECQAADGQFDAAVKALQDILQQPLSKSAKAHAYNILGDCYYNKERWQEALWNYLYVDVVYHQNREEHARALYYLSKVFEKLGDKKRAGQYKDRLNSKALAGTEYQRRLALEKNS
ncbi:MAG TPA: tetratricopeptide repeat protein [Gemmataceae bacterium]|nr:tetratricopeptide repeat protein [Gemmataceae bacterium]